MFVYGPTKYFAIRIQRKYYFGHGYGYVRRSPRTKITVIKLIKYLHQTLSILSVLQTQVRSIIYLEMMKLIFFQIIEEDNETSDSSNPTSTINEIVYSNDITSLNQIDIENIISSIVHKIKIIQKSEVN